MTRGNADRNVKSATLGLIGLCLRSDNDALPRSRATDRFRLMRPTSWNLPARGHTTPAGTRRPSADARGCHRKTRARCCTCRREARAPCRTRGNDRHTAPGRIACRWRRRHSAAAAMRRNRPVRCGRPCHNASCAAMHGRGRARVRENPDRSAAWSRRRSRISCLCVSR